MVGMRDSGGWGRGNGRSVKCRGVRNKEGG